MPLASAQYLVIHIKRIEGGLGFINADIMVAPRIKFDCCTDVPGKQMFEPDDKLVSIFAFKMLVSRIS